MNSICKVDHRRAIELRGIASLAFALAAQFVPIAPARAAPLAGHFLGGAQSVQLSAISPVISLEVANSAHENCPCRGTFGRTLSSTTSLLSVGAAGQLLTAATATATAFGDDTATTATTTETSTISKLSALGGLITADALRAVATVGATPEKLSTSEAGTNFANLVIAGTPIDPGVPENTIVALPGIGSVTIRAVTGGGGKQSAKLTVRMLVIDVTTANGLGLPVGARLVIGRADAGYDRTTPAAILGGYARAAKVIADAGNPLDETAGIGSAVNIRGCTGTDGKTLSKTLTAVNLGTFLSIASSTDTAFAGPVGSTLVADTTSALTGVSLLNGLITVSSITADAKETRTGNVDTPSPAGSSFTGLTIANVPVSPDAPPNTKILLPLLGYVIVNEQIAGSHILNVNGLHLTVTTANLLGLPVGAQVILGHASASATKF